MIIIVGESASGKTTLARKVCEKYPEFRQIVTYTTRPQRPGEIDSQDYKFLTKEKYEKLSQKKFFVEENNYRGWNYAIARKDCVDSNYTIAVLTPAGFRAIRRENIKCFAIYLKVDRRSRLIKLLRRGDNIEEAYRRNLSDLGQFDSVEKEVDFVVANEKYQFSPESLVEKFLQIFQKIREKG